MKSAAWLGWAPWLGMFGIVMLSAAPLPAQAPGPAPTKYWVDMHLAPVPKALAEQLELKDEGLLIEDVGADGPADKAGIKRNDILLAVGDKPVKRQVDLESAIAEGKELSIKLLRAGKPITVSVTPALRPEPRRPGRGRPDNVTPAPQQFNIDMREIERMIREKLKEAGVDGLRMQFFQPGKIFPPGGYRLAGGEFPDDLTVNIHKQGKAPAEIEVKKGDKTWNVKEDNLAELPEDVRPHVEAMLGRGKPFNLLFSAPGGRGPGHPEPPQPPKVFLPPDAHPGPPGRPDGPPPERPDGPPGRGGVGGPGPERPGPPERAGRGPRGPRDDDGPAAGPQGGPPRGGPAGRAEERLQRRLDELSHRMQELREQIDSLRRNLHSPRDREEDDKS